LGDRGRFISEEATGCELRFVTKAKHVRITLCIPECDGIIRVYKGGLFHSEHRMQAGVNRTLHLDEPVERFNLVSREQLLLSGFAPEVWRICFGRTTGKFMSLNTFGHPIRPPSSEEIPKLRWLAYGSSITHGLDNSQLTYIHQAARQLKVDVMNLGLSGSCMCESEVVDFIAARDDWDMASFEVGVNMRDSIQEGHFQAKTAYLLERVIDRHPNKHLFLITIYPNFATYANNETTLRDQRFNEILRNHTARMNHSLLHLIEGDRIMQDMSGLSCDLIHPGEYGNIRMGEQLANAMKQRL